MNKLNGYLCMVLHTHLPYINHPENDNYIEEQWLYEAISETYIPLITYFNKLIDEKVKFKLTMSLTPPLLEMLSNKIQQEKYIRYVEKHIELCEKEVGRTEYIHNYEENELAKYYLKRYKNDLYVFKDVYKCDLISQFKKLQDAGVIEIVTCCATHGYLPMLCTNEFNIELQIKYGVETYKKFFGKHPNGIWLAECGYTPEVEKYLKKYNLKYFFTEMHGVIYANPVPIYGVYAPILTPNNIAVFGRNVASTMEIWSSETGYPGDSNYREFSRDIGFDLDIDYIKPYIAYDGVRIPTGIKYYSVSGKQPEKNYYNLQNAKNTAETHAYDYMQKTINIVKKAKDKMNGKPPIIVSMQDTELYGHWWYEGPYWLYIFIKKMYYDQNEVDFITPTEYLKKFPEIQVCKPNISSWGSAGTNIQWTRCEPADIYIQLQILSNRLQSIIQKNKNNKDKKVKKAIKQLKIELLLLQSSDWYFNLTCHRAEEYSYKRINMHIERFNNIYEQFENNNIDEKFLKNIEFQDAIFNHILLEE